MIKVLLIALTPGCFPLPEGQWLCKFHNGVPGSCVYGDGSTWDKDHQIPDYLHKFMEEMVKPYHSPKVPPSKDRRDI